ncbi:hypothetical protein D3C78_1985430 [compost metagenome]
MITCTFCQTGKEISAYILAIQHDLVGKNKMIKAHNSCGNGFSVDVIGFGDVHHHAVCAAANPQ